MVRRAGGRLQARLPVQSPASRPVRWVAATVLALLLAACANEPDTERSASTDPEAAAGPRVPVVTISDDQQVSPVPAWQAPPVEVDADSAADLKKSAQLALEQGELFGDANDAIPSYLALRDIAPEDPEVLAGLERALEALLAQGSAALGGIDSDPEQLRHAHQVAAVARAVAPTDEGVIEYLELLDRADQAGQANLRGERALNQGQDGQDGAIGYFRQALALRPADARARQGLAAAESGLIRKAELAAEGDDYATAETWLGHAAQVRPDMDTAEQARQRIARQRGARVGNLRDEGIAALSKEDGLDVARGKLATLLRIAPAGDPAAIELREQIELVTHYGLFRPGQAFTEALEHGGRGPEMVVIPHGAFRMGAGDNEPDASESELPVRSIRFDRGLAVSRNETTVGEFRRFVTATGYESRASRRQGSTVYDERSGNLVHRSHVDWRSDYTGAPAADDQPVVHVSAKDAEAYARWLSEQTGHHYRLPSEAEFEYMLRAGSQTRFPWGDGAPPSKAGNFTGGLDQSPTGRGWRNAFDDYGDGSWGPARVGSYADNAYGLHDLAGNVSEWVGDCWHDSYRRAPSDGRAWINPGCRDRVVRGGSWASSPSQTRSAWRLGSDANTTNARVGFRVVREI
ncbi:SUMF1/EgtB/PvdO family nonheme iron enzyme [Lysobacter sp. A378]